MSDPHSQLAGLATGAGLSSVSLLMGAQVDALIVGLIASVIVSIWMESVDNKLKATAAVLFSALLAGYGSPVAAQWVAASVPSVGTDYESLRLLLALLIGGYTPRFIPGSIAWAENKIKGGAA